MIRLAPKQVTVSLWAVLLFLVIANSLGLLAKYYFGYESLWGLIPLFDLNLEKNIPTLFSTVLLLFSALLLAIISADKIKKHQKAQLWVLLTGIFVFLAIDEFTSIHERLIEPVRELLGLSGMFYFAWVIPYWFLLMILAIIYGNFMLEMPSRPRWLVIIAFTTYVVGALGFEMIGGWYYELNGQQLNLTYSLIVMCEESLEMLGLLTFVYAMLVYIDQAQKGITIQIG